MLARFTLSWFKSPMTDRLSLANALADAKIDRPAAERIATEIFDAIQGNVATKSDMERLEAATRADVAAVKVDVERLEAATKADFQRLETHIDAQTAALRSEMMLVEHRLLTRLGGLMV